MDKIIEGYVPYEDILNNISEISEGDFVYLTSDMMPLSYAAMTNGEKFDSNVFIDSIIKKIGPKGTLLIPAFNWSFCGGTTFDIRKTPSKVGALGKIALKRDDFKRTKHPIYSFMVWGAEQEKLCSMDYKDSFGPDTIFDYMHKRGNVKDLCVGINTSRGLTFVHYVEECVGVPFRYIKDFTAGYIDYDGVETQRTYSMYVRDLEIDAQAIDDFNVMGKMLEDQGAAENYMINDVQFHVIDFDKAYGIIRKDIEENDCLNLYSYDREKYK